MTYRVAIRPEVAAAVLSLSAELEGLQEGRGKALEEEFERVLGFISTHPLMYRKEFGPVRRAALSRFRWIIFYTVEDDRVTVLLFQDARLDPPDWPAWGIQKN